MLQLEQYEKRNKINSLEVAKNFKRKVQDLSKKLQEVTFKLKKDKKKISCYGAAAKGMTILKCSKIDNKIIDYFVDDSPAKQGLFSAGDHVQSFLGSLLKKLPDYFIISAPNFAETIIKKEKNYIKKGGKFIIPKDKITIYPN